jgi:hypothetical protein
MLPIPKRTMPKLVEKRPLIIVEPIPNRLITPIIVDYDSVINEYKNKLKKEPVFTLSYDRDLEKYRKSLDN